MQQTASAVQIIHILYLHSHNSLNSPVIICQYKLHTNMLMLNWLLFRNCGQGQQHYHARGQQSNSVYYSMLTCYSYCDMYTVTVTQKSPVYSLRQPTYDGQANSACSLVACCISARRRFSQPIYPSQY